MENKHWGPSLPHNQTSVVPDKYILKPWHQEAKKAKEDIKEVRHQYMYVQVKMLMRPHALLSERHLLCPRFTKIE